MGGECYHSFVESLERHMREEKINSPGRGIESSENLNIKELREKQLKELREKDRRFTCDHSALPSEGRLFCYKNQNTAVGGYCNSCDNYKNEELEIGVN